MPMRPISSVILCSDIMFVLCNGIVLFHLLYANNVIDVWMASQYNLIAMDWLILLMRAPYCIMYELMNIPLMCR